MKSKRVWAFGLGVTVILVTVYALVGPAEEVPFVLSDAEMESLYGSVENARCVEDFGCGVPNGCKNNDPSTGRSMHYHNVADKYCCHVATGYHCTVLDLGRVCWKKSYGSLNCTNKLDEFPTNYYRDCNP